MSRALQLWERFQSEDDLKELIDAEFFEDQHIDFKSQFWGPDFWEQCFAEILSGFANADGGVVIFGARANSEKVIDPATNRELIKDVVTKLTPLKRYQFYAQQLNNRANSLTQPEMHGILIDKFASNDEPDKGYIKVYIPKSEGPVLFRSAKNYRFFCRIGHSIKDMPIYMMTDRMGRRPQPNLEIKIYKFKIYHYSGGKGQINDPFYELTFTMDCLNKGLGAARNVVLAVVHDSHLKIESKNLIWENNKTQSMKFYNKKSPINIIYPGTVEVGIATCAVNISQHIVDKGDDLNVRIVAFADDFQQNFNLIVNRALIEQAKKDHQYKMLEQYLLS